jgi:hypothetical protein
MGAVRMFTIRKPSKPILKFLCRLEIISENCRLLPVPKQQACRLPFAVLPVYLIFQVSRISKAAIFL